MSPSLLPLLYAVPAFISVLAVIIVVHEMGHYWVARWNDVAIDVFSVGFGSELWGRTDRRGTRWRISAIPLGGYVRFTGDMNAASLSDPAAIAAVPEADRHRLFVNKNVWQRIAIVAAGPLANGLFTFLVLYVLLLGYGRDTLVPVIDEVVTGGVAEAAGMQPGDRIVSVDSFQVRSFFDFQRLVATAPGREVVVTFSRDEREVTLTLVPEAVSVVDRFGSRQRIGRIGVISNSDAAPIENYRPGPLEAVAMTFEDIRFFIDRTLAFLGDFFVGRGDLDQLGGPVKVAKVSGQVATFGLVALINLAALVSLNVGMVNLLPIPMLDGGHLLFYAVEAVRGRPLSRQVQEIGFRIGFAVVVGMMLFTLLNDTLLAALR